MTRYRVGVDVLNTGKENLFYLDIEWTSYSAAEHVYRHIKKKQPQLDVYVEEITSEKSIKQMILE